MNEEQSPERTGWMIAAAVATVIAVLGLPDITKRPFTGLSSPDGIRVAAVTDDGPAARAGIQVGDRMLEVAGVETSDFVAVVRQPRGTIGDQRSYRIERDGVVQELTVTLGPLPSANRIQTLAAAAVGFAFLLCGIGVYWRTGGATARLLAILGVFSVLLFCSPPYIAHTGTRMALFVLGLLAGALVPALLVHVLLHLPERRRLSARALALIYVPAAVVVVLGTLTLLVAGGLLPAARVVGAVVPLAQVAVALFLTVRAYWKADPARRAERGLTALLIGVLAGILPVLVVGFAPPFPGSRLAILTLILIPLALAYAVTRSGSAPAPRLETVAQPAG